jgi:hypothetical protein
MALGGPASELIVRQREEWTMTTLGGGDESMPKPALAMLVGIAAVFGVSLILCTYVLLFRDTSNAPTIATVIGLLIGGLLLTAFGPLLSEFAIGPVSAKLRVLDKRVSDQQKVIDAIRTALDQVITRFEYDKLEGLEREGPFMCYFHDNLMAEMKRLYDHGFVAETEFGRGPQLEKHRGSNQPFDLKWHFVLTESGKNYLQCRRQWHNMPVAEA